MTKKRVLIVEDDPTMRLGMSHFLAYQGYGVDARADGREGLHALETAAYDLVITDLKLPHADGFAVLEKARAGSPPPGVIMITGHAEIKTAVQAIKNGAFDYLAKPFSNEELLISVERFFNYRKLEEEVVFLKETLREKTEFENFIGISAAMKDVFGRIGSVAGTDVPVLIQGESGTGKELAANALHRLSPRAGKPFIKINCAAIPESLFESELFGYEKGAFTGAVEARKGKFEYAGGGTIFFDEIGDIPLSLQPKLLRVLEDGIITRLGSNVPLKADVRGLFATSKNLKERIAAGTFREDLYYRINVVPIVLPPLQDRGEDIPCLIDHFLANFRTKYDKAGLSLSVSAYNALLAHRYSGNVRELKHAIERAVILAKNGVINIEHLPEEVAGGAAAMPCVSEDLSLDSSIKCFEKQKIIAALKETGGKKMDAAKRLGITRKVLWKKIKEYQIE
ncbi:MAG: sigma-54 dependent transcriptional regulator [Nitrospirota bacterium]|nr:sigma-54 dependent transcriptional regulator [Nitrospirota bacterium]